MPAIRTNTRSNRLVRCTCEICCADWDPHVHLQSSRGKDVSRSTRDNHRADQQELERRRLNLLHQVTPPQFEAVQDPPAMDLVINTSNSSVVGSRLLGVPADDLMSLTAMADELKRLAATPLVDPHRPLIFSNAPSTSVPFVLDLTSDLARPNCSHFSLTRAHSNQRFLRVENSLAQLHHLILSLNASTHTELLDEITVILGRIIREKHLQWNQQLAGNTSDPLHVNTEIFFFRGTPRSKVYRSVVLSALVMSHIYSAPRRAVATQLAGMRSILRSLSFTDQDLQYPIPRDPRTTTTYYNLHPITRKYISCPACHCLYLWNGENMDDPQIAKHCTFRSIPHDDHPVCGTNLWKIKRLSGNRVHHIPVRIYAHQPLKYWLGRLLSRPLIEDHIERASNSSPSTNGVVKDIWDTPLIHSAKGHDGLPFLAGSKEEGRLVFSLAVDSFNPQHVKAAHSMVSSTGIWLVLLNLPEHLRYLHQNMYVAGVIPGPQKPSLEQLNHYIDLVVDDLLEFHNPGVRLSCTFKYALGRVYKAMLIPLICDMLAARQVIGQAAAPTSHNFCTVCDIDKDDINILDPTYWPPKNISHIRKYAEMWRDAPSINVRQQYFDGSGMRWSPLLRLSYWNPVKYTVIDAMHTLDLGLFQNHCRVIFALNVDSIVSGDGSTAATTTLPPNPNTLPIYNDSFVASYKRCIRLVVENDALLEENLIKILRQVLYAFCVENDITSGGRDIVIGVRCILARSIVEWRSSQRYTPPSLPEAMNKPDRRRTQQGSDAASGESDGESTGEVNIEKSLVPVIRLLLDPSADNIAKLKPKGRKTIYITLCELLGLDYSTINLAKRPAKQELQALLLEKLKDNELRGRLIAFLPSDPATKAQRVVLGKDLMQNVWDDMKKIRTPTWVATAPPNWGTAERGKLSAAQWRVVCTIHLPITLIRVWQHEEGRKRLILDHFMDLVSAVRIANMKVSTPGQVKAYNHHIFRYVSRICELYPDQHLKPTHHLALHIGDFLEAMGPTHSHNSPFFERYINFFHHQNTNSHPGQLETTLLYSSAIHANLRGLLEDDAEIRPLVFEMVERMDKIDKEDIRGFRLASILDPSLPSSTLNEKSTPATLSALQQRLWRDHLIAQGHQLPDETTQSKVNTYRQIAVQGVRYSTTKHIFRDSTIMFAEELTMQDFALPTAYESLKAGFVEVIFQSTAPLNQTEPQAETVETGLPVPVKSPTQYFFVIRELVVAESLNASDPFKRYGVSGGFLCRKDREILRIISLDQVKSHATLTEMSIEGFGDVYHILCVDRLMNIFTAFDYDNEAATGTDDSE